MQLATHSLARMKMRPENENVSEKENDEPLHVGIVNARVAPVVLPLLLEKKINSVSMSYILYLY